MSEEEAAINKLKSEIKIMNDKMDLSGVSKKVDTNVE